MKYQYWGYLAAGITTFDTWLIRTGRESLTQQFGLAFHDHPVAVTAATAYLLAHLYGLLPKNTDLLLGFGTMNRRPLWETSLLTTSP